MAKIYKYKGKTLEELEQMNLEEFSNLLTARERRALRRGLPKQQKKLLEKIRRFKGKDKLIRTHSREMVIVPEMVGAKIGVYNGHEFIMIVVDQAMVGHRLGEFSQTRKKVQHSAPGLGATRSSKFVPLK